MRVFLRSVGALFAGYAVITIVTIVAFPALLGHALVEKEDPWEVFVGTLIAVGAGMAGGYVATLVGVLRPMWNAALAALPVAAESTYILAARTSADDFAFAALGSAVLIGSTLVPGLWKEMRLRGYRAAALS